jgi:hypothetical protein
MGSASSAPTKINYLREIVYLPIIKVWFDDGIPVNTHCAWSQMRVTPGKLLRGQVLVDQMTWVSYSKRLENGRKHGTDVTNYHDVRPDNEA